MKKLILFIGLVWVVTPSLGLREFYSLTKSIRSLGMGGAFYGLSDDEYALFYNPAGLALYRGNTQVMLGITAVSATNTLSAINKVSSLKNSTASTILDTLNEFQGRPIYAEAGIMLPYFLHKNFAAGLLVADTKVQMAILGKDFDTSIDVTAISDSGLFLGYGTHLWDGLNVGATLKGVFRAGGKKAFSILDIAQGTNFNLDPQSLGGAGAGIDFDLGGTYEFTGIPYTLTNHVSLVFSNMLASELNIAKTGTPPGLQRMVSLGFHSVLPGYGLIDNVHLLFDLAEIGIGGQSDPDYGARGMAVWKHINFGAEVPISGWFMLRAGVHQGYFTAGLGISSPVVKLDFTTYEEDLGYNVNRISSRRWALRLAIGGGSATGAPVTGPYASGGSKAAPEKIEMKTVPDKVEPETKPETKPEVPVETPKAEPAAEKPEPEPEPEATISPEDAKKKLKTKANKKPKDGEMDVIRIDEGRRKSLKEEVPTKAAPAPVEKSPATAPASAPAEKPRNPNYDRFDVDKSLDSTPGIN